MTKLRLFNYIEPYFCGGLLDDPLLLIRIRPTGRSLLFDCGQLYHLAKRVLRSIDAVFITHAHMDHFIGLDHLLRHTHVSPRPLALFGPAGIVDHVRHKLASYDWNLAEPWWRSIYVHEVHHDWIERHEFAGSRGFTGKFLSRESHAGEAIYTSPHVSVEARIVDHALPALTFRLTERKIFTIAPQRLATEKLLAGPWLGELKRRWQKGSLDDEPLEVLCTDETGAVSRSVTDVGGLYQRLHPDRPAASIGYVTDLGFTTENLDILKELLAGVSLLCCECTFLASDQAKARASRHLCSSDLNHLAGELCPKALLPMHLSKAYLRDPQAVYGEITPPTGTRLLQLPDYLTPRPRMLTELSPGTTNLTD